MGVRQSQRRVVFVSGAPGAGKTSLAVPLAAALGFALVCKDRIKETLHDALGAPPPDLAWSRRLGAAAMELLWVLAADASAVVVEANFRPHDGYQRAPARPQQPPATRRRGTGGWCHASRLSG
jgi:predicted kinase